MISLKPNYCLTSCECDCHHNYNFTFKNKSLSKEKEKDFYSKLYSQFEKKPYEPVKRFQTVSSGCLENTMSMSTNGSNWRAQPQLAKTLLYKRRPEEMNHSSEIDQRIKEDNMSNYTTYQPRSRYFENEKRKEEQKRLKTEANELRWENENLLVELEKQTKEKNSAIAMSHSLQRVLNDYSSKTKLQCGDESFKHLLLDDINELKNINSCYNVTLNHTFEFLKYVSINEGIEMKEPSFYIQNESKYKIFLQKIYQCLYSNKDKEMNQIKEIVHDKSNNNKEYSEEEIPLDPKDDLATINKPNNSITKKEVIEEKKEDVKQSQNLNQMGEECKKINHNHENNQSTQEQKEKEKEKENEKTIEEEPKSTIKQNQINKKQLLSEVVSSKKSLRVFKSKPKTINPSKEKTIEGKGKTKQKIIQQQDSDNSCSSKIKDLSTTNKTSITSKSNNNPTNTNSKAKGYKSEPIKGERTDKKETEQVNREIVVERKEEMLYKKKKPIFQSKNSKSKKKINIETSNDNLQNQTSSSNIIIYKYGFHTKNKHSNYNNCITSNTNTTNTNDNNCQIIQNSNYYTTNHNHSNSNVRQEKSNKRIMTNDNKDKDNFTTLKVHHFKSQSMTNIQSEEHAKTINQINVDKLNEAIKKKLQKARTHLFRKRTQSPIKSDSCQACNVDCNVSSSGYSPMTYFPFGERIRRHSYTPTKVNPSK